MPGVSSSLDTPVSPAACGRALGPLFWFLGWEDSWGTAGMGSHLSQRGQSLETGWRGEMQPWRCRGWQRDIVVGPENWHPGLAREGCLKGTGTSQVLKAGA